MADTIRDTLSSTYTTVKQALSSAPPNDAYLPWDSPGVEVVKPDESAKTAELQQVMERMQRRNFAKHRRAFTATHVKTRGIVKGTLKVQDDLPEHLQQGIFAEPGRLYDLAARYANEPFLLQADQEPGPRGMSMKIFGVNGPRLEGVENPTNTQDFLFNNSPSIELIDLDTTSGIMSLRDKYFDDQTMLGLKLKLRSDLLKQHAPYMLRNTNILSHAMYTQSAFRFGEWYCHIGLFPVLEEQKIHTEAVNKDHPEGVLSDWLFDYFKSQEAKYDIKIQLGTDPSHHPTEDASVIWDESTAPYHTLGTITFPPQDSFDQKRRVFWEDHLILDPWRGLVAHQPLGSINRLRKDVYPHSQKQRDTMNASRSMDVDSIDDIP